MYTLELYIEEWKDWIFHCRLRTAKQILDKRNRLIQQGHDARYIRITKANTEPFIICNK
tara:strand:+ start:576 stop:752 length:177 start_codon:yes stop_codon:yes gene_type:complete